MNYFSHRKNSSRRPAPDEGFSEKAYLGSRGIGRGNIRKEETLVLFCRSFCPSGIEARSERVAKRRGITFIGFLEEIGNLCSPSCGVKRTVLCEVVVTLPVG